MDVVSPSAAIMRRTHTFLVASGSAGLMAALAADCAAVLGRHLGFVVIGSIELFQVAMVVAISSGVLLVSLLNRHVAVDFVIARASDHMRARLAVITHFTLALTFGIITGASAWIAAELWTTDEMTELLQIRLAPFRLVWLCCCTVATVYFFTQFVRGLRR